ncbi:hypothetical protein KTR66_05110 [Roseococcus sp. SDR]|uniref:hypothetical protein n=1 Tax=Roseococcus sp. SDR TaxID=2835532 RepID=UPI001BCAB15A|nr:hypothetical protein [Roseococcus sp. SDR]MBS7789360.1 hypothetical protein [Roseococcus sp. SDR]MBV1844674.1 hypothetical protein [Roseococcus sp. SDR]
MFRSLIIAATLVSGAALAQPHPDVRSIPGGVQGNAPAHVDGVDGDGNPIIHRPEVPANRAVTAGPGRLEGGAEDNSVTRTGPGRGTMGGDRAAIVTGNEEGRPVIAR